MINMKKFQRGFTLLEIVMVTAIMGVLGMVAFQEKTTEFEQERARALGGELLKFNNAVRDYVSFYAGDANYASKVGVRSGVNWLKLTSCGGSIPVSVIPGDGGKEEGFLPCNFLTDTGELTSYGKLSFSTVISSPAKNVISTKTTMSELKIAKKVRGDLSGLAAIVAGSASALNFNPVVRTTDGTARFCITETVNECVGSLGRIILMTSNDASNDTWLRTDGSNTMNNSVSFLPGNPDENRTIQNVSKLFNVDGSYLTLGNKTGALPTFLSSGIVVDSDAEIMGILYVNKIIDRNNSSYYMDPSSQSKFNVLNADSLNVTSNIVAGGTVTAKQFIDADNSAFFVDPNALSKLHDITTRSVTGEAGSIALNGVANLNSDLNVSGKTSLYGQVYLGNIVSENTGCPQSGAIARDVSGKTLSCQNGIWIKLSGSQVRSFNGSDLYDSSYTTPYVNCLSSVVDVTMGSTFQGNNGADAQGMIYGYINGGNMWQAKTGGYIDRNASIVIFNSTYSKTYQVACNGSVSAAITGTGTGWYTGTWVTFTFE